MAKQEYRGFLGKFARRNFSHVDILSNKDSFKT